MGQFGYTVVSAGVLYYTSSYFVCRSLYELVVACLCFFHLGARALGPVRILKIRTGPSKVAIVCTRGAPDHS